jgi:hypothetical protein
MEVEFKWSDTVQDIKEKLFLITNVPPERQHIIWNSRRLDNTSLTLKEYAKKFNVKQFNEKTLKTLPIHMLCT